MVVGLVTDEQLEALGTVAARLDAKGLAEESRILHSVLDQLVRAPREIPASSAAEILGVTQQTVRNWVRAGVLPGQRDRTGHFYVSAEALAPALRLRQVLPGGSGDMVSEQEIDDEILAARNARRARAATDQ